MDCCLPGSPGSLGCSRQECWSGLPSPSLGDPPGLGIEPHLLYYTTGRFFTVWATRRFWGQVNILSKDYYAIHIKKVLWNTHFGTCRWHKFTSVFTTAPGTKVGTLKHSKTRQQWSSRKGQMGFSQCCLPGGSETSTFDVYRTDTHNDTSVDIQSGIKISQQFAAALFTRVKRWKQPKCPASAEWINKVWSMHKYYLAIERNTASCYRVGGLWKHDATWNKSVPKGPLYDSPYMKCLE